MSIIFNFFSSFAFVFAAELNICAHATILFSGSRKIRIDFLNERVYGMRIK